MFRIQLTFRFVKVNTGFFATRSTDFILNLFNQTIDNIKGRVDQFAFNSEIKRLGIKYSKNLRGLDKLLYPNGHVYFQSQWNAKFGIRPLIFHANYVTGSTKKKDLFKMANMWYLPE
jgi:hypothetical protein